MKIIIIILITSLANLLLVSSPSKGALLAPLSITFFITWVCILAVWYFLGLPLGPGGVHFKL